MSRSGYSYDAEGWGLIRWRGAVASAIRGKRGQAMLREMRGALDAMPVKRLITSELKCADGVCALGALGEKREIDMTGMDAYDRSAVASTFNVAEALAAEVMFMNDEGVWCDSPEERWRKMRSWISGLLKEPLNATR